MKLREKPDWRAAVACALCVVIFGGMIVSTILLSQKKSREWEYVSADDEFDYYQSDGADDYGFQYAASFRSALATYFNDILGDFVSQYFDVEITIGALADKVIAAMSSARIPAAKLGVMTERINDNSIFTLYSAVKNGLSKYDTIDELTAALETEAKNFDFFGLMSDSLSTFIDKSTLTEKEFARFVYYFLAQNTDESYSAYMKLVSEDFFETLISDTVYVITTFDDMKDNGYQLLATSYSLQEVLYQLGATYTGIASLPGGAATLERVLWWTWDFSETRENAAELNAAAESIRGRLGGLLTVLGYVLREVTVDDVSSYCEYKSLGDGREKNDYKIYSAYRTAKLVELGIEESGGYSDETSPVEAAMNDYSETGAALWKINYLLWNLGETEEYYTACDNIKEAFDGFTTGCEALSSKELTLPYISSLDENSDEYKEYLSQAENAEKIFGGLSSVGIALIIASLGTKMDSIIQQAEATGE